LSKDSPFPARCTRAASPVGVPSTRGRLSFGRWTGGVGSIPNPALAVSAYSLSLERWTGGVGSLSNPAMAVSALSLSNAGQAVSVHSRTLIASQVVLDTLALFVYARSSRLNFTSDTK
jgi:hypothetical protein